MQPIAVCKNCARWYVEDGLCALWNYTHKPDSKCMWFIPKVVPETPQAAETSGEEQQK